MRAKMRTRIDERTIRSLVRQSLARRMLTEQDGSMTGPTLNIASLFGMGGGGTSSGGEAAAASPPSPNVFRSGRRRGESAANQIAELVGGKADIDPATSEPLVGASLGERIKTFIDSLEYVNKPFTVTEASSVVNEWDKAVDEGSIPAMNEIGPDGKPTKMEMAAERGAEGLLRYLIFLKNTESGLKVSLQALQKADGDYQINLKPLVDEFVYYINGSTSIEHLETIASETVKVVRADKTPQLFRAKLLLAGFSRENSTTYELLTPPALMARNAAAILSFGPIAYFASPWLVGQAFQSIWDNYIDSPVGDMINAVNNPEGSREYLSELSKEVSRTYFVDSGDKYRRDQIASSLAEIASARPDKSKILSDLEGK